MTHLRTFVRVALFVPVAIGAQEQRTDPARIDSIFAFATNTTPGCAVATVRNGAIDLARGYGMADLEHDVPITPGTSFYLASVSKQFTAAAINLLVTQGKLSLEDDIRKFIPELPRFDRVITVRHLMHHTSGLRDYLSLFPLASLGDLHITNDDVIQILGRQRALNFPTGDQYSYSNSGYVLMSIIVERVTGKSLRVFAQERMFEPLGMASTVFRDRQSMLIKNRALAYFQSNGTWAHAVPHLDVVGDGGLFSTVEDLARWERQFMEPRFGGDEWTRLTEARGRLTDGTQLTYGAGLTHGTYRGEPMVQHGGGYGGYSTYLMRFPRQRLSVAVLCNGGVPAAQLAQRVANTYLPDAPAPVAQASSAPVTVLGAELVGYKGRYYNDQTLLMRDIVMEGGKLYYVRGPGNRSEMQPIGERRFQLIGTSLVVAFVGKDTLRIEASEGASPSNLRRVSAGNRPLREYVGAYTSSDLQTRWTVAIADTGLVIRVPRMDSVRVDRAFEDAFLGRWTVRFRRDERGQVSGMDVSAGERARHIRFDRAP